MCRSYCGRMGEQRRTSDRLMFQLVDQGYPESDGLEVLGELRSRHKAPVKTTKAIGPFRFEVGDTGSLARVTTNTGAEISPVIILFDPPDERRYRFHVTGPPERGEDQELRAEMTVLDGFSNMSRDGDDEVRTVLTKVRWTRHAGGASELTARSTR